MVCEAPRHRDTTDLPLHMALVVVGAVLQILLHPGGMKELPQSCLAPYFWMFSLILTGIFL